MRNLFVFWDTSFSAEFGYLLWLEVEEELECSYLFHIGEITSLQQCGTIKKK